MTRIKTVFGVLAVWAVCLVCGSQAQAQATRTWVSGVGDDANPCSRTAPCKTFAGAISKTAAGGEISTLDPGGFGAVTITKSITISGDGTLAGILAAGTNGIIVNAGVNDVVIIRSLSIHGAGTGLNGIRFLNGRHLHVENCTISGFGTNGIDVNHGNVGAGEVTVRNTSITNVGNVGIRVTGTGTPTTQLRNVRINRTSIGFDVLKGSATISDSVVSHVTNQAVVGESSGTVLNAVNCVLNNNGTGISAFTSGVTVNFANCDIFNNTTGVSIAVGATGNRFGNNRIINNGTDISGTTVLQSNQ